MVDVKVKVKVFVVEVEVCPLSRVESCFKNFCPLLPPNGPPWSSLIIGESLSLNGSPGLWSSKKCEKVAPVVVRDHCRPSYGHQQSKKVVEFLINSDFEI